MARLLRWRVLMLDASVMLLPANPPAADARMAGRRGAGTRGRLSEAVKDIDRAEHELALARRANHVAVPPARRTTTPVRS